MPFSIPSSTVAVIWFWLVFFNTVFTHKKPASGFLNLNSKGISINSFWSDNAGVFFRYEATKTQFSLAK
jgi:hypothetical protein